MAIRNEAACTIATLVDSETVQLKHVGGPVGEDRAVFSATCIVRPDDFKTLRDGDIVLLGVPDIIDEFGVARIVESCTDTPVAAVAIPEWMMADAPDMFLTAAAASGLPVYMLPIDVRIADVVETIAHAHAAPDVTRFQRLLHMQQLLVDALSEDPPVDSLVRKLATLTGGIAGITDEVGNVEVSSGVLPFVLLRQEVVGAAGGIIEVAGWVAIGRRLRTMLGESPRWLFVAKRAASFATTYVQSATSVTASLLDGTRRINEIAADQDLVTRAFVLKEALATEPYENADLLATRAGALGIDFAAEARVLELHRPQTLAQNPSGPRGMREAALAAFSGANLLVLEHDAGATVLVQCPPKELGTALDRLLRTIPGLLIGIGRPLRRIGETRVSWHDATLAVQTARRVRGKSVVRYDDFDLGTRLVADVDRTEMSYWVDELLDPIRERPILMEALRAYFDLNLDIMKASKRLDIHHNTLRYRLAKIEELVGGSIQSPARIASLHLALSTETTPTTGAAPLQPSARTGRRGADVGDTDVVRGGAAAPSSFGVGDSPELD